MDFDTSGVVAVKCEPNELDCEGNGRIAEAYESSIKRARKNSMFFVRIVGMEPKPKIPAIL